MQSLLQDVRYAFRVFRANPALVAVAVLSLAIGIGPNSVLFSLVDGLGMRPLPIADPAGLVSVAFVPEGDPSDSLFPDRSAVSYLEYVDVRDHTGSFAEIGATAPMPVGVSGGSGPPEFAIGAMASASYFSTLGVRAALGRTFLPEEDRTPGTHAVALLSDRFWKRRFQSNPDVIGASVRLNAVDCVIVGVLPAGFDGTQPIFAPDVWVPTMLAGALGGSSSAQIFTSRSHRELSVFGRLRNGVSPQQAQAEMTALAARLAREYPDSNKALGIHVEFEQASRQARLVKIRAFSLAIVSLVLVLACANVAGLLLGRGESRRSEIAVRLAMGASRRRLIQQLLTESALLSLFAAAAGLLLALWLLRALPALIPAMPIAFNLDFRLDLRVLGFTLIVAFVAAPLFGLMPALAASRPNVVPLLKGGTPGGGGRSPRLLLRNMLVLGQISISLALLVSSALLVRSFINMQRIDPGFLPRPMVFTTIAPPAIGYGPGQTADFFGRLLDRLSATPGVERASMARHLPLNSLFGGGGTQEVVIPHYQLRPGEDAVRVPYNVVEHAYFDTMGVRLVKGRYFAASDGPNAPGVILINQTMARRFWPAADPIGQRVTLVGRGKPAPRRDCEIVGVIQDGKYNSLGETTPPYLYIPYPQQPIGEMTVIARVRGNMASMTAVMRREITAVDPLMPVMQVTTLDEHMRFALTPERLAATLVAVLGGLGLLLSAMGLYGVIAFLVSRRTQEIGVRLALGASPGDVKREVVFQAGRLALAGVGIGLLLAAAAMGAVGNSLHGVSRWDPISYFGMSALVLLVALAGSYVPARRASRVDPMTALRTE